MKRVEIAYKEAVTNNEKRMAAEILRFQDSIKKELGLQVNPGHETVRKIKDFYQKVDRKAVCQLLDQGYTIREVQQGLLKSSPFAQIIIEKKFVQNYCDTVMNDINRERMLRSGKLYEIAKESYLKKSLAIQGKYANYSFDEFQEGKVVISMLRDSGFFPEIVEAILEKHSRNPKADKAYVKQIMKHCNKAKENYLAIDAAKCELRNAADCYRLFAREYLSATKTIFLNGRDEQKIVARMFSEGISEAEVVQALAEASPIAVEPGRKKENYVRSVLNATKESYQNKKAFALKNYPETLKAYLLKIDSKDKLLKEKGYQGVVYNRSYHDGIAAKALLEERHLISNIEKAIAEISPQASKPSEWSPNKTPQGYAKWIRIGAQKALAAEKAILDFVERPIKQTSYKQLVAAGISAVELYKTAISERLAQYPSIALHLSDGFIDKDACEKILHRYPDIKIDDLKEAITEASPRAQLPGIPDIYPKLVLEDVQERQTKVQERKESQKEVQTEYMRRCGLSFEGVNAEANMLMYHDGRAVLEMLQSGIDQAEIKSALLSGLKIMRVDVKGPERYAETVIEGAKDVNLRIESVKQYKASEADQNQAENFYLKRLQQFYEKKNYVSSSMDIAIAAAMLSSGKFTDQHICNTIQTFSPTAAEPGRDDRYVTLFILIHAKEKLEQEKMKLKQYTVIPRIDRETLPEKEYVYHQKQMQEVVHLPISETMDLMIAAAMLEQGFKDKEVVQGLTQSPCAAEKQNYGLGIVKTAVKNLGKRLDQGMDLGIERPY